MPPQPIISHLQPAAGPCSEINVCSPVFIVGLGRSGSTLLARMLDAHSALAIFPETWCYVRLDLLGCLEEFTDHWQYILFLNEIWESLHSYKDPAARVVATEAAKQPRYAGPTAPLLELLGKAYARTRSARIWGEKTPGHVLWLPQIHKLFPKAHILVSIRDPRDVLLSYDERWGGGNHDTAFLMKAAAQVRHYLSHLLSSPGFPPEQIFWVKYEALTAQPSTVLRDICRFLGLEFEPGMLEFYRQYGNVERDFSEGRHHKLLSRPATTERVGRYREAFTPSQVALVEEFLAAEMNSLGYPVQLQSACTLGREEELARDKGRSLYEQMGSGAIRRNMQRKARLKLTAYRWFGGVLASLPRTRLAVTSKDWLARADLASRQERQHHL